MVFSATPLGLFLYFHIFLLFFIPRVAGSVRTVRSLALDPRSKPPHSGPDFLSTSSPGLFLGLEIPGNTSLIKVYGRKRTGASLYGICLECNGTFETVNASLTTSEQGPICLFSLALKRHTDRLLELHNLYDPRFGTYGELSFSFVEYTVDDEGHTPASTPPMQICEHHLHWPPHYNALLRRDDTSNSTSASSPTCTSTQGPLSGRMNILIGLIAALVTLIVLIFIVVALYVMFRHRLFPPLKEDPEDMEGKLGVLSRSSPRNKSTTLFSPAETANPETHSKYTADPLPKDRYITEQETHLSDPTTSFSTHVDLAQMDNWHQPPQANTSPLEIRRASSRPRANPPPCDPPNEPVPEVPKTPQPLFIRPSNGPPLPPASGQNRSQRPLNRTDRTPVQGVGGLGSNTGSNTPESYIQRHIRDKSSSDLSSTSHEGRLKARPPSKVLPSVPTYSPAPSGLLFSTSVQTYGHLTQNSQEQIEAVPIRMQTIPESNRSSDLEKGSPSTPVQNAATQEFVGSSANTRQGAVTQSRPPQEFRSRISHPEYPEFVFGDVRRGRDLGHTYKPEPLRRESRESIVAKHLSQARLSIRFPADPEDWFSSSGTIPLSSSTEGKPIVDMKKPNSQGQSSDWKIPPLRYTPSANKTPSQRAGSHPQKEQRVARQREVGLSPQVTVIAPLSTHKRALPTIPT